MDNLTEVQGASDDDMKKVAERLKTVSDSWIEKNAKHPSEIRNEMTKRL